MNKVKVFLGILLLFTLGTASGSLGTMIYMKQHMMYYTQPQPRQATATITISGRRYPNRMARHLTNELGLNPQQQQQIDRIMLETNMQLAEIFAQSKPQVDLVMQESLTKMLEHLSEEQQQRLLKIREQMMSRPRFNPADMHHPDSMMPDHKR